MTVTPARRDTATAPTPVHGQRRPRRLPPGFTLLEILVALVVVGLLFLGLLQGSHVALSFLDRHTRLVEQNAGLDGVDRVLRRLIERASPGSKWERLTFAGTAHSVTFTSVLPGHMPGVGAQRVDVGLSVDNTHRLLLSWTPHVHAIRTGPPPAVQRSEVLQGVDRVDLSYWPTAEGAWTPVWHDAVPPRLVRVRIVFVDAHRAPWPDIVAAPRLDAGS